MDAPTRSTPTPAADSGSDASNDARDFGRPESGWRRRLFVVIFESDTPEGRAFDLALIGVILTSITVVMLDSVPRIAKAWGPQLNALEWAFTGLFTIEYVARLLCVKRPLRYATSFYGIVDLVAVAPTFLALLWPQAALLIDVRVLRLLRIFRIFKLSMYAFEYRSLASAVHASRRKIAVFIGCVLMVVLVMGTLMYVVEGPRYGFTSIPVAVYWAITTMTTVGFGDIAPHTGLGRFIASVMMLLGWGVLAVPTGIVTAEMAVQRRRFLPARPAAAAPRSTLKEAAELGPGALVSAASPDRACPTCLAVGHAVDARYCRCCGTALTP